jgi:hypothetical protein
MSYWLVNHNKDAYKLNNRLIGISHIPKNISEGDKVVYHIQKDDVITGIYRIISRDDNFEKSWIEDPIQFHIEPEIELQDPYLDWHYFRLELDKYQGMTNPSKQLGDRIRGQIIPITEHDLRVIERELRKAYSKQIGQKALINQVVKEALNKQNIQKPHGLIEQTARDLPEKEASIAYVIASGQGFASPAELKAIEKYSMDYAISYFINEGYTVKDVSADKSYDLEISNNGEYLFVEVKGTKSEGAEVILTRNEVRWAKDHEQNMILFIVHSINSKESYSTHSKQNITKIGSPWHIDDHDLSPICYRYTVSH